MICQQEIIKKLAFTLNSIYNNCTKGLSFNLITEKSECNFCVISLKSWV